ncbi:hypothetical protein BD779DRAFT_1790544 [Infundibulicybe gibba]|nr:hypothetical protein BD779DRAFT_1790544 [Infundibulicybe gibba]
MTVHSMYGTLGPSEQAKIFPRSKPKAQKVVEKCYEMTKKEVESMKGWDKIKKHADEKWGTGSRRVVVNPKEHPGRGAVICSAGVTRVEFSEPSCVDSQEEDSGIFDEAKNTTRFIIERHSMFDARWVIGETSSFGPKLGFKTTIRVPKVYDSSRTLNSTTVVTNIKGAELNITARRDEYVDVKDTKKGEKCVAKVDVRTCDALGRGSFSPAARGWVWFIYDKPTGLEGEKHTNWAVKFDGLPRMTARAS